MILEEPNQSPAACRVKFARRIDVAYHHHGESTGRYGECHPHQNEQRIERISRSLLWGHCALPGDNETYQ